MMNARTFYVLLSVAVIGIMALPVGIANFVFGYFMGDSPCILCWGQRLSMVYIAACSLFVIRYGLKPKYLGAMLVMAAFGLYQSFYHLGAHALEDAGQGFALEIFSIHTQFWAELVFWSVVVVIALLMFFSPNIREFIDEMAGEKYRDVRGASHLAFCVFFVVTLSNMFQALISSGPPPYLGSGDPPRFSFDVVKQNEWSTEGWKGLFSKISFLGDRRTITLPDLPRRPAGEFTFNNDPSNSPLGINSELRLASSFELPAKLGSQNGDEGEAITTVNFVGRKFWVGTDNYGFYILGKDMRSIEKSLVLDRYFSATVGEFVGLNKVGSAIRIMGNNKTSVDVVEDENADPKEGYKHFYKGADQFTSSASSRKRFLTSRAKLNYIGAATSDGKHTYMVTVPNKSYPNLVIVSQLDSDKGLASEYRPEISDRVTLKDGRSLNEFYVTAATYRDGKLYAASRNYNTVLVIDVKTGQIVDTMSFPSSITNVRGMTFVDSELMMVSYENSKNMVHFLTLE